MVLYQKPFINLRILVWRTIRYSGSGVKTALKFRWSAGCLGGGGDRVSSSQLHDWCTMCLMLMSMIGEIQEGCNASCEALCLGPIATSVSVGQFPTVSTSVRSSISMQENPF